MIKDWKSLLRNDPLPWLLEESNPHVRYNTLVNILNYDKASSEVRESQERIMDSKITTQIFELQDQETGVWYEEDIEETVEKYGYTPSVKIGLLPKYKGTFWQTLLLSELAITPDDSRAQKACNYLLKETYNEKWKTFVLDDKGTTNPCFVGTLIRIFSYFGLGLTSQVQNAIQWVLAYQRFDDANGTWSPSTEWPYLGKRDQCFGSHSCYIGIIKTTKPILEYSKQYSIFDKPIDMMLQKAKNFILVHEIFKRSHNPTLPISQEKFGFLSYPLFYNTDFLEALDLLSEMNCQDKRMNDAVNLLLSKQNAKGRWILERSLSPLSVSLEEVGKESKWITYRALKALTKILPIT